MNRFLTEHDKHLAFVRATRGFSHAVERWHERARKGLTDEQLVEALKFELGTEGGSSATDRVPAYSSKAQVCKSGPAGTSLRFIRMSPSTKEPPPSPRPAKCTASPIRRNRSLICLECWEVCASE